MFEKLQCPLGITDIVIDSDTYNEIDDQFALAYAFASFEKLNIKAVYAAPFVNDRADNPRIGMEKSRKEIFNLLEKLNKKDFKDVYGGSDSFLKDENTPVISEAARHLVSLASGYMQEKPLYVVALAALTDIASALLIDPSIADKIVVVWLGGAAHHFSAASEFNLNEDIAAARVVFDKMKNGLVQVPCKGVVSAFITTEHELVHWLKGKNALCDYLLNSVLDFHEPVKNKPWSKQIWDVVAVAWLLNDEHRFMTDEIKEIPLISYDGYYSFPTYRGFMKYVNYVYRDALFEDLFKKLGAL